MNPPRPLLKRHPILGGAEERYTRGTPMLVPTPRDRRRTMGCLAPRQLPTHACVARPPV